MPEVYFKTVFDVLSKPVKSNVASKRASNLFSKLVESNFTWKSISNEPSKEVKPNVPRKCIRKVNCKLSNSSGNLSVLFLIL